MHKERPLSGWEQHLGVSPQCKDIKNNFLSKNEHIFILFEETVTC